MLNLRFTTVAGANILFKYEAADFLNPQVTFVTEDFKKIDNKIVG